MTQELEGGLDILLRCSRCRESKEAIHFPKNKGKKTGHGNQCKACNNAYGKTDHNLKRRIQHRDNDWSHALTIECRSRARKAGIPFNLTEADLAIPLLCPVLGIPLFRTRGKATQNTPTVDRIFGHLGYIKGNVTVISWKANRLKSNCDDPSVFEAIASYIRKSRKPKAIAA